MNKNNTLAVIIPTKNRPVDLLKCIDSILVQTMQPDELIIVDQTETSVTDDVILRIKKSSSSINLNYIHDTSINGLIEAKKKGVKFCSKNEIIIFLEDDVILDSNYLEAIHAGFLEKKEMIGCCGVVKTLYNYSKPYLYMFNIFHRGIFIDKRVGVHGVSSKFNTGLIKSSFLSGGTSAYRREVFDNIKFDTKNNFFMLEDIDFSVRATRKYGEDAFYINTNSLLEHNMSPINRDVLDVKIRKKLFEYTVFFKKNSDRSFSFINYIWLLFGLFIESIYIAILNKNIKLPICVFLGAFDGCRWEIRSLD